MKHYLIAALTVAVSTLIATPTIATAHDQKAHANHHDTAKPTAATESGEMTNAEVRKIDKSAKKITLKHEAIKSLDMPGMTMVFQVIDASLLDKVQVGDKVKFKAKQDGSAYVVTDIASDR
jgi:Cu(I)/Ag(I) efflux system periplasmic protein CusF